MPNPTKPPPAQESDTFLTATDAEHTHHSPARTSHLPQGLEHKVDVIEAEAASKPGISFAAMPSATSANPPKVDPFEMRSFSVKLDGQVDFDIAASIEHQIDIHVMDLVEVSDINGFTLSDILEGLKYVMDYRIRGGKMLHLNYELMEKLMEALLQNMGHEAGSLMKKRPTVESDLAFTLFGEFLEEVEEFRRAVGTKSATDLRQSLNIHRRCQPYSSKEQREDAAGILNLLTTRFVQFEDWRELVRDDEHDDAEELIKEYAPRFMTKEGGPVMPPAEDNLFPPP
ncbi:hypothetical protein HDU98_005672, partial [Podochytrium sp. JEL0797]